ncbi:MAG: putative sulfate exporter family transporter [Pseudomonadota bacterium]
MKTGSGFIANVQPLGTGLLIVAIIALAARFISDHYGAPAMLMALLFGIALNFLSEQEKSKPGIAFASKTVLRIGVALLGLRISADMALSLGWETLILVISVVLVTILFGMGVARFFGFGPRFGFISAGSVAICGASAAMAIAAILPKDGRSEERLVFTVVGVTILSTVAMIAYPILADQLAFGPEVAGVFLGATIHDVAQVVGAGFSVSDRTGEVATIIKLIRVAMLAPVIIVAAYIVRQVAQSDSDSSERPPLVPVFVAAFFVLLGLNSTGLVPQLVNDVATEASRWALLSAIAAVGIKTSIKDVLDVGGNAIALLVTQTLFIAFLAIISILALKHYGIF